MGEEAFKKITLFHILIDITFSFYFKINDKNVVKLWFFPCINI